MAEQNYSNHTRIVPLYHYGTFLPLLLNLVWALYVVTVSPSMASFVGALLALTLIVGFLSVRGQILRVQDRVIRLELRLRMREVLPPDLAAQALALPVKHLVALRFASDGELPGLVSEVLGGTLATQKAIKMRIRDWQADHLRA